MEMADLGALTFPSGWFNLHNGGFNVNEHSRESRHKQPIFGNSVDAFQRAIKRGALSNVPTRPNYAGLYMYMGTVDGVDKFKHTETRRYIS
ncbi:hypothetical protein LCGC14_0338410 [marine sediment metagenome]|uniref:Uncharacterized protein n=1 Tax=marine sediment metagenome TaxID=412755 RepID=A0A0F9TXF2_9ZZZZ